MEKLSEDPPVSITVKMQPELKAQLEAWRVAQLHESGRLPSLSEAVRDLLGKALSAESDRPKKKR